MNKFKLWGTVSLLLICAVVVMGLRFNAAIGTMMDGHLTYSGEITWNILVTDSVRTTLPKGTISVSVEGAGDTAYSDVYRNKGRNCVQFLVDTVYNANDVALVIKVQSAIQGDNLPAVVPEWHYKDAWWIKMAETLIESLVSSDEDSIEDVGITAPVMLPLLESQLFRFVTYPCVTNDTTLTVSGKIMMKEY